MFDSLGDLLQKGIKRHKIKASIDATMILKIVNQSIEQIFGKGIHRNAVAAHVRGKIITIYCSSSILAQEIRLQEQQILKHLIQEMAKHSYSYSKEFSMRYRRKAVSNLTQ